MWMVVLVSNNIWKEEHCSIALKQGGWGLLLNWFLGLVWRMEIVVEWSWGLYGPMDQSIYCYFEPDSMWWHRPLLSNGIELLSSFPDGKSWFLLSWTCLALRRWTQVLSALEATDEPNLEIKALFRSSVLLRPRSSTEYAVYFVVDVLSKAVRMFICYW